MRIKVNGKFLSDLFKDFVKTKTIFNFKTDGNTVYVQMLDNYTACTSFPCDSLDGDHTVVDCSFLVTKAVGMLDKDLPVEILFSNTVLFMEQKGFSVTFTREHEERRVFPDVSGLELKNAYANRLKYLTHSLMDCSGLAKELSITDPDPVFVGDKFYADYRQTFFIEHMQYPTMCFAYGILRDFAFRLDENAEYCYIPEQNICYFRTGRYELWIPTMNFNIDGTTINAIERKLTECVKVTDLSFVKDIDKMLTLSSSFPKQRLNLSIGNGKYMFTVMTNTAKCVIGEEIDDVLLSINITAGQVAVIAKLFKDDETVECLRGGNCICLTSKEKSLLIAGLLY